MIQFNQETCGNLDAALRREWLETNGLGGFASSTITGLNTRRYHGLLVAATQPPVGREVLLSKLEETLVDRWPGRSISPPTAIPAWSIPRAFATSPTSASIRFPSSLIEVEGIVIEKTVFMVQGENTTVVQYELKSAIAAAAEPASRDPAADRLPRLSQHDACERRAECQRGRKSRAGGRNSLPGTADFVSRPQCAGIAEDRRLVQKFRIRRRARARFGFRRGPFQSLHPAFRSAFERDRPRSSRPSNPARSRSRTNIAKARSSAARLRCRLLR